MKLQFLQKDCEFLDRLKKYYILNKEPCRHNYSVIFSSFIRPTFSCKFILCSCITMRCLTLGSIHFVTNYNNRLVWSFVTIVNKIDMRLIFFNVINSEREKIKSFTVKVVHICCTRLWDICPEVSGTLIRVVHFSKLNQIHTFNLLSVTVPT